MRSVFFILCFAMLRFSDGHSIETNELPAVTAQADLLYGKIHAQPTSFLQVLTVPLHLQTPAIQSKPGFGFRVAIGVELHTPFDLLLRYSWLQNRKHTNQTFFTNFTTIQAQMPAGLFANLLIVPVSSNQVHLQMQQTLRWQQGDFLLKTACMRMDSLSIQPLGGIRYLQFNRNYLVQSTFPVAESLTPAIVEGKVQVKQRVYGLGAILGCNFTYLITNRFHLFSSAILGILAGHHKHQREDQFVQTPAGNFTSQRNIKVPSYDFHWHPSIDAMFGFDWQWVIHSSIFLSLKASYSLNLLYHQSATPFSLQIANITSRVIPLYFLVQTGTIGMQASF